MSGEFKRCLDKEGTNRVPIGKNMRDLLKRRILIPFSMRKFSQKQMSESSSYIVQVMMKKNLKFVSHMSSRSGVRQMFTEGTTGQRYMIVLPEDVRYTNF